MKFSNRHSNKNLVPKHTISISSSPQNILQYLNYSKKKPHHNKVSTPKTPSNNAQKKVSNYLYRGNLASKNEAVTALKRLTVENRNKMLAKMKSGYYDAEHWASRWNELMARVSRISGYTSNRRYNSNNSNYNNINNQLSATERNKMMKNKTRSRMEEIRKKYNIRSPIVNTTRGANGANLTSFAKSQKLVSNRL